MKSERGMSGSQVLTSQGADGDRRLICEADPSGSTGSSFIQVETEAMKEEAQVLLASFTYVRCFGVALTKAHNSLLRVLIGELQSKVPALVDRNSEPGETRTRRAVPSKRTKVNMLPINELTWPELARRYILAFLSMDGNLESVEITARESGKLFGCLRGDGGLLSGSLTGVAGMEADALLLEEAMKKIFGSLSRENDVLIIKGRIKAYLLHISDSDNQHMNSIEGQLRPVPVAVESQCTDKSLKSFPSSNHMHQAINGYSGATHIQGNNYQKCEIRDVSTCATYQQGKCIYLSLRKLLPVKVIKHFIAYEAMVVCCAVPLLAWLGYKLMHCCSRRL
ncbi:uncharacterized protein LOC123906550 [Trifolium pratense]|uniref:uncharacterized protein LOC123906550 n=1 Tax=Trifolium pratense TaxID=57577 RepID=UPI001E69549A|nr:uncharacterized protein LOC123906550 [Trifolium pratense]XP_045812437.1 uncharacterized protein LOC123906550 [Trifolium pratense]